MLKQVVLIVEDEPVIRLVAASIGMDAGFTPLEAANADEAIEILERRSDIGVVFTDVSMPGSMDGLKLAKTISDRWPPIGIIITSGQTVVRERDMPDGAQFLPKPYDAPQLVDLLEKAAA